MIDRYVVGFVGRRDHYQIAVALEESRRLAVLCTDLYVPDFLVTLSRLPGRLGMLARSRHVAALPSTRVRSVGIDRIFESRRRRRSGMPGTLAVRGLSDAVARAVADEAKRGHLGAVLYNFDWMAYRSVMNGSRARVQVLVQAHPPPSACRQILRVERDRSDYRENPDGDEAISDEEAAAYDASLADADLVVCSSTFVRDLLVDRGVDLHRLAVLPYGGRLVAGRAVAIADPRSRRAALPLRLLWVGEFAFRKGYHLLFEAFKHLPPGSATLTMVCRPLPPRSLLANLPAGVTVRGPVSDRVLADLYATHDVFVMPSLVEGFGHVYLEAMQASLPVIGTAHSAVPDLVVNERDGFIVAVGDVLELAEAMQRFIDDRDLVSEMGSAARRSAEIRTWGAFRSSFNRELDRLEPRVRA